MDERKRNWFYTTNTQQQQALRRLKHLHTPLARPANIKSGSSLKPIQTSPQLKDFTEGDNEEMKQFALSPDTDFMPFVRAERSSLKRFRLVRKGRAPLVSSQSYFNPTFRSLTIQKPLERHRSPMNSGRNTEEQRERNAKSAPASGGTLTLNPSGCECLEDNELTKEHPQQLKQEMEQRIQQMQQKQPLRLEHAQYKRQSDETCKRNVRIHQATSTTKHITIKQHVANARTNPPTLYRGWGIRSNARVNTKRGNTRESRDNRESFAAHFQALRITSIESDDFDKRGTGNELPPPPAPPTPIRQIAIQMPGG